MATAALLPFDPAGTNPLSRITNEPQVITAVNFQDFHFVVPKWAPFFLDSMQISFKNPDGSTRILTEGVDYYFAHHFLDASKACAKPIYGSIQFLDTDLAGVITMSYQSVGGTWTLNSQEIAQILADSVHNPRITSWEQVVERPVDFPVIDHEWDLVDMVGASEIVEKLADISDAILTNTGGGLSAHVSNKSNPHEVTKAQVGLGNVQDFPVATTPQAQAGTNNTSYMTPMRTREAIIALGNASVAAHADRVDNPHQVSKSQIGLGLVPNYAMATQQEAMAGTSTTTFMSPALTDAVVAVVRQQLAAHTSDLLNPHIVTKQQIFLGNVENYPIATAQEAQDGNSSVKYMTPLRVRQAITAMTSGAIDSHVSDTGNPHATTKQQVGLGLVENYPIASAAEAVDPAVTNRYMTPSRVSQAINTLIKNDFITHLNAENPHNVTKAQVGLGSVENYPFASQAESVDSNINNRYMSPAGTALMINAKVGGSLAAHLAADNPHNITKTTVGLGLVQNYGVATVLEAQTGTSNTLYLTPLGGKALVDQQIAIHAADNSNPHGVTKLQVGLGNVQDYGIATNPEALAGSVNNKYMTPQRVAEYAQNYVPTAVSQGVAVHANRTDNPHSTTAAQVGAYTTAETDSLLQQRLAATATAVNSAQLEGKSLTQVMQDAASNAAQQIVNFQDSVALAGYLRSYDVDPANSTGFVWVKLAELAAVVGQDFPDEVNGAVTDLNIFVSGGDSLNALYGSMYYLHASIRDSTSATPPVRITAQSMNAEYDQNLRFGWTWNTATGTLTVYMRVTNGFNPITATSMHKGGSYLDVKRFGVAAPAGVTMFAPTANNSGVDPAAFAQLQSDFNTHVTEVTTGLQTLADAIAALG